ncbi:MAG: MFS transporter [Phascolarctobacterium sp.]|nr:MFS transporter [Phascolarctobacterium sp.]
MMNKSFWAVISLAIGHLVTDMQAGALPIVLPHLKELFSLSYAQMATIVLTQNITSSVIQPVFGYITDKRSLPALLPYCAALAGAGFAAVGWVSSYALLLLTVIIIGVSSASYHPQASKTVNFLSDENSKAQNMGLFSLGGNAGMAAGSMMMTFLIGMSGGLHNTMYFVLPGILVFCFMMHYMPEYKRVNLEHSLKRAAAKAKGNAEKLSYFGLAMVLFFIFMRSTIHTGISTYLPLFFMKFRDAEPVFASLLVTVFLLGGVAGTYIGAVLSDKLGASAIIIGSMVLSIPPIWALDKVSTEFTIVTAVAFAGFFIIGSNATTIVLAQTMLPNNVGMAAGLTIGFSVGLGGLGVTILGVMADNYGLPFVIQLLTWLSVGATLMTVKIPIPESLRKKF